MALLNRFLKGWRVASGGVLAAALSVGVAASHPLEYAVKANFLYKFAPFVDWPPNAFPQAGAPFNVCVLGSAPFGTSLDQATRGQTVGAHAVAVRRINVVTPASGCHVLYVGRSDTQRAPDALAAVHGEPVLTVTDASQGVSGGMIHFVVRDGRVRFIISPDVAKTHGLSISSKLLSLAVEIRKGGA
ncbi:MAG: YfiR family protein [Phenylobacterium sp.]|nr:YfiR family protein [Phenylobacterium sp.]